MNEDERLDTQILLDKEWDSFDDELLNSQLVSKIEVQKTDDPLQINIEKINWYLDGDSQREEAILKLLLEVEKKIDKLN